MLTRARGLETIEAAYESLAELRREHLIRRAHFASEFRRIDEQGALVLGAVRTAQPSGAVDGLALFQSESKKKLDALRASVAATERAETEQFVQRELALMTELRQRVERRAALAQKPVLRVMLRSMPNDQRILHLERLAADDAVSVFFVLTGKLPSRYGFLFDDSTDDVTQSPPWLYADEGVTDTKPTPAALQAKLESLGEVWPVKGMMPLWLPGDRRMARWLQRGPVMEAEVADGDTFRNVLTPDEAERMLGALLSLKLAGRLELELVHG